MDDSEYLSENDFLVTYLSTAALRVQSSQMSQQHDDDSPLVGRHHYVHYDTDHLLIALFIATPSDVACEDGDERLKDLVRL